MIRKIFSLCLVLFSAAIVVAQESGSNGFGDSEARMATGMSVLGNDEAPKSLFIVPWKTSEMSAETSLNRALSEYDEPVDREVFMRHLDFFEVSTKK